MILLIAGSRTFNDYELLKSKVEDSVELEEVTLVISGGANGADLLAEKFALEHDLEFRCYPADWDKYGKRAGFIRNSEMVSLSDIVLLFWDGKSKGTESTLQLARNRAKPLRIFRFL